MKTFLIFLGFFIAIIAWEIALLQLIAGLYVVVIFSSGAGVVLIGALYRPKYYYRTDLQLRFEHNPLTKSAKQQLGLVLVLGSVPWAVVGGTLCFLVLLHYTWLVVSLSSFVPSILFFATGMTLIAKNAGSD